MGLSQTPFFSRIFSGILFRDCIEKIVLKKEHGLYTDLT